jgi:hypothetical protein
MKLSLLLAWALLAGLGCEVKDQSDPCGEAGSLTVSWSFVRHTAQGDAIYDCAQAGVKTVALRIDGVLTNPRAPWNDCGQHGTQRITLLNQAPHSTRSASLDALDEDGHVLFQARDVPVQTEACNALQLSALASDLEIDPQFTASGGEPGVVTSCDAAGVGAVRYALFDSAGTAVAAGDLPCAGMEPARLTLPHLDLGTYTLHPIQGLAAASSTPLAIYQACDLPLSHLALHGDAITALLTAGQACP